MSAFLQQAHLISQAASVHSYGTGPEVVASLTGVTKRYRNGVVALDNLSLTLGRGEVVALLGPNGAGKSTAVKLMMGLSGPTAGTVRVFGQNPRFAAHRLRTGVMLQVGRAPETLRVCEHIELFQGYYPHPMPMAELIRIAGLEGLEKRLFGHLSGGQKQRVLFALALSGDPDLVFLDEPTVGLDIEARRAMWTQIRALAARGKTVLLTTHYLEEADALASRIVVINKGRVVCQGTPAEVKARGAAVVLQAGSAHLPPGAATTAGAGVKIITCTTTLKREHLLLLPAVTTVDQHADRAIITTTEPEAVLREMLALDPTLNNLIVASPALEDAFLALTAQ
jgi:ABC-2 type transport system ATP-binding protein